MNALTSAEKQQLDRFLDGIEHLPPAPVHMIQLIKLFQDPERDLDAVIELLSQNPPLVAEVLRRCNSSFFGSEEPVMDITEAFFRLGFYEVYRLTVTLFGKEAVIKTPTGAGLEVETIWRHSTITAVISGIIGRELGETEGIVFTAGLLHDIGKIVLALAARNRYATLTQIYGNYGPALKQAETLEFGFSHAEVGAWLLDRWQVPELIAEPVFQHHRTQWTGVFSRPSAIVNLADFMAHLIEDANAEQWLGALTASPALTLLQLSGEEVQHLEFLARSELKRSNLAAAIG